jgi:hypothetical protein
MISENLFHGVCLALYAIFAIGVLSGLLHFIFRVVLKNTPKFSGWCLAIFVIAIFMHLFLVDLTKVARYQIFNHKPHHETIRKQLDDFCYMNLDECFYGVGFHDKSELYALSLVMDTNKILYRISYERDFGYDRYLYDGKIKNKDDYLKLAGVLKRMMSADEDIKLLEIDHKITSMLGYIKSGIFSKKEGKQNVKH